MSGENSTLNDLQQELKASDEVKSKKCSYLDHLSTSSNITHCIALTSMSPLKCIDLLERWGPGGSFSCRTVDAVDSAEEPRASGEQSCGESDEW